MVFTENVQPRWLIDKAMETYLEIREEEFSGKKANLNFVIQWWRACKYRTKKIDERYQRENLHRQTPDLFQPPCSVTRVERQR